MCPQQCVLVCHNLNIAQSILKVMLSNNLSEKSLFDLNHFLMVLLVNIFAFIEMSKEDKQKTKNRKMCGAERMRA